MKEHYTYKSPEVWQRAHVVTLIVYKLTDDFPENEIYGLTQQIRRAAVSVPANIVEGVSRSINNGKLRFINIAQTLLAELEYELILSQDPGYMSLGEIEILKKMPSSFYNSIKSKTLKN